MDAALAAPAATAPVGPDLSCAPSAAPAAESDDSSSAENGASLVEFAHVNKKIKATHESSTE